MKTMCVSAKTCALALAVVILCRVQAHAYIDANTGSMALQAAMAGFGGIVLVVKLFWRKLTGKL